MEVKIAAFGTRSSMQNVLHCIPNQKIKITPFIYEDQKDCPELVRKAYGFDALFFTGPVPYYFSLHEIEEKKLPSTFILFDEYVVSITLYYVTQHLGFKSSKMSFDIHDSRYVYSVLKELKIDTEFVYIKEYQGLIKDGHSFIDELVEFHYGLWKAGKIDFAITGINSVYEQLIALGVNCFKMIVPQKNILDALNVAYSRGELMLSKKSQIVVGFVSIKNYDEIIKRKGKLGSQELVLELHQLLLQFGKEINASIQFLGNDRYIIFGTRGPLEYITNQYQELPILSKIQDLLNIHVSMGFGFGINANEAEENAQIALHYADQIQNTGSSFIVTDNKLVIGPMNDKKTDFHLRIEDDQTLAISKKTGLSVSNISKLIKFWEIRDYKGFTSRELAEYYQFSKRSSDRMLKKLLEENIISITGEEQPFSKGRPRSVYKVNL
ncbi:Transcriptional regulator OS=Ureibacillus acetophenoni OX=614649 GN=SAMN05877842_1098 PE=4 SV=1 [Ureibacillus acetophenoni]